MTHKLQKLKRLSQEIRVLYVEDEDALREITLTYLRKYFIFIDSAKDGQEGEPSKGKAALDRVQLKLQAAKKLGL